MSGEMVSLKVDPELVKDTLNKRIQAAIVSQLGDADQLIAKAVSMALSVKVQGDGTISRYESDNRFDFLDALATKSVREAATAALQEWLAQNAEKIKQAVLKELKKPSRQRSIATAYANAIEESLTCKWHMSCNISFKEEGR